MTAYFQELFQFGFYKRSQGRVARQVTLYSLLVVAAAGAWSLNRWLGGQGADTSVALFVPLGVLAVAAWAAFRLVQVPRFADFLISVEAEMSKVSWPARGELYRASAVVILVIFLLAGLLFVYDYVLRAALSWLARMFGG